MRLGLHLGDPKTILHERGRHHLDLALWPSRECRSESRSSCGLFPPRLLSSPHYSELRRHSHSVFVRRDRNDEAKNGPSCAATPSFLQRLEAKGIFVRVSVLRHHVESQILWPILVSLTRSDLSLSRKPIALGPFRTSPLAPIHTVGMNRRGLVASKKQCGGARINFARKGEEEGHTPHSPVHSYTFYN